jgi:hypothetical protein
MKARLIVFAVVASSDTNQEEQEKEKKRSARCPTGSADEWHKQGIRTCCHAN